MADSSTSVPIPNGVCAGAAPFNNDPLCRCRVLYIGSAVPTITKDGLQGIQQPLKERYPATESPDTKGIDSWLSVWSNGLLLEYVDGERKTESAFFPIATLHYCAAVRYVNMTGFAVEGGGERFIPLDTPFAHIPDSPHPPIFAAIFRRTHGVKVLECHAFVCTNEKAANALVRCCFHAYADTLYLKMDEKVMAPGTGGLKAIKEPSRNGTPSSELNLSEQENGADAGPMADWNERAIGQKTWQRRQQNGEYDASSVSSSLFRKDGTGKKSAGSGGRARGDGQPPEGTLVPYGGRPHQGTGQAEPHGFSDGAGTQQRRHPFYPAPFASPPGPATFPLPHPPPPHIFPPPPPFILPPPPGTRFVPFRPFGPPRPFGRFGPHPFPPPPFPPRLFFMHPPPPFLGTANRPKSPERSGPIITDYDTFPRHNRTTTYEEPIYMPSSNGAGVPPQASYKPGSFSPEIYEHYYETYNRQQHKGRKNVSRSNSDASGGGDSTGALNPNQHYWEGYEASMFRRSKPEGATPKMNGTGKKKPEEEEAEGGRGGTLTREEGNSGQAMRKARGGERPETPPADYDEVAESKVIGGARRQNGGGTMAF